MRQAECKPLLVDVVEARVVKLILVIKIHQKSWVYILECSDGSYYTGCTTDLEERITEHQEGKYDGYTAKRLPIKLLWKTEFRNLSNAIDAERQIKGWSRKKKEALMNEDFELLHVLAQSQEMKQRRKNRKK